MQLPLDLKWSQARNRRSVFGLYIALVLVAVLTLWSLPKLIDLLLDCFALLLDADNRRLILAATLTATLAIGGVISIGSGAVALWHLITTRIWQIPQRYAAAIEHLGDKQIDRRLEGIQTLRHIAKLVLRDHRAITKTLAAFVQEQASIYQRSPIALQQPQPIAADIQAALTVIGRKPLVCRVMWRLIRHTDRQGEQQINIGLTNLSKARLRHANLREANLYSTNLQQADLQQINLQSANLQSANLQACNLHKANLQAANLQNSNLEEATLDRANLQQANLYSANLRGANLYSANLQETSLQDANLQESNLYGANLRGAFLYGANLQETSLQRANLQAAFLPAANLQGANLYKANLQSVTGLTDAQLSQAKLCMTVLPDGSISDRDCAELGLCDRPRFVSSKPVQETTPPQPSPC